MLMGLKNWDVDRALPVYWICWDLPTLAQIWVWLAHSRLEPFWWCAERFSVPCDLVDKIHISLFSSSGLGNMPGCQVSRFSLIYTAKRVSTEKVRFFLLKGKKTFSLSSVSQDLKVLGQRKSFHFTFMPVLATGRGEIWNRVTWISRS